MATWYLQHDSDGQKTVLYKDKTLFAPAGTCSAATSDSLIMEWIVNEADPADVIVTDEGVFVLPMRCPLKSEVAC